MTALSISRRAGWVALVLCAAVALACSEATSPVLSPLAGLERLTGSDSGSTTPPDSVVTPGYFRGTVMGYEPGPDTLITSVGIANVKVTAYPRVASTTDTLGVGPAAASVLTNSSGVFQLPTLPGGEYIVTFNTPEGSLYRGGWTVGFAHSHSGDYPWFIMLPKK